MPARSNAQQLLTIQLHAFGAAILIDLQPIRKLQRCTRFEMRILAAAADVAEGDGLDCAVAAQLLELHLQMPITDDAHLREVEPTVEHRLRKSLTPGSGAAQHTGSVDAHLLARQGTVREDDAVQGLLIDARGDLQRKGAA